MSDVSMLPVVVLIVCKTVLLPSTGVDAENSAFTKHENREFAVEHGMLVCRREEVQMFDTAEAQGADPQTFNQQRCTASAVRLGSQWDIDHTGTNNSYRTWRVACPTPMIDTQTGKIVGWVLPDCGHRDTVLCEKDSVI